MNNNEVAPVQSPEIFPREERALLGSEGLPPEAAEALATTNATVTMSCVAPSPSNALEDGDPGDGDLGNRLSC